MSIEGALKKDTVEAGHVPICRRASDGVANNLPSDTTAARQKTFVQLYGVYQRSEAWIKGHSLRTHANGNISFAYDLTPYLPVERSRYLRSTALAIAF